MADFRTHVLGAGIASGVAATAFASSIPIRPSTAFCLFGLGVAGGLLPDLDSDQSVPLRVGFSFLATLAAFSAVFHLARELSLLELAAVGSGTFLAIRYGVFHAFTQLTVHRGLFHSIPAAVLAGLAAAIAAHGALEWSPLLSWVAGSFVGGGFLVHLLLDELYSVDLLGRRVKRSFGTALCLGSSRNPLGTLLLYASLATLYPLTPPAADFVSLLRQPPSLELLHRAHAWHARTR